MNQQVDQQEAPRGVMATIAAGFDLTTKHWGLLLLPVALDLFYWLGPRLSFDTVLRQVLTFWQEQTELAQVSGFDFSLLLEAAPQTNLFTSLSVPFLGVPAFVVGIIPENTPLAVNTIEIASMGVVFLFFLFLTVVGLLLTAVYYNLIALSLQQPTPTITVGTFTIKTVRNWLQLLVFCFAILFMMFILYMPLTIISALASLLSPVLAMMILFIAPVLMGWLLIYFFFAPHGLILNGRSLWTAMIESMMLVQQNLTPTLSFILAIIIIGQLLDWLLLMANDGSWFMIVSIMAHAFVNTALVVASFIFYQERLARVVIVNSRFYSKKSTPTP